MDIEYILLYVFFFRLPNLNITLSVTFLFKEAVLCDGLPIHNYNIVDWSPFVINIKPPVFVYFEYTLRRKENLEKKTP
jgi:hypothetical protein